MRRSTTLTSGAALMSLTSLFASVSGHEMFVSMIPNGANVDGVAAVGHVNPEGDGATNSFGQDFADAYSVWTKELCEMDSDGDGQTNGQELGDPCCEWDLLSSVALRSDGLSNPGDADSTSDKSLWADVVCPSSSASNSKSGTSQSSKSSGNGETSTEDASAGETAADTNEETTTVEDTAAQGSTSDGTTATVAFASVSMAVLFAMEL